MLSALEIEKLNFSSLFGIYVHCYPVLFSTQVSDIGPSWSSCHVLVGSLAGEILTPVMLFVVCLPFGVALRFVSVRVQA